MSNSERFKDFADQDPRLLRLEIARRNFERNVSDPLDFRDEVLWSGYFDVLKDLLQENPSVSIFRNVEDPSLPGLAYRVGSRDYIFTARRALRGGVHYFLCIAQPFIPLLNDPRIISEVIRGDELPDREKMEIAILSVIKATGFRVGKNQEDQRESKHDSFRALRVHPEAFRGLSKEEGDELLKNMYRFGAKRSHPDRGGSEEEMKRVNNARDFLSNPDNRII